MREQEGISEQDTHRPSPKWAFCGRSHTELEDKLLAKIDAERARERLKDGSGQRGE